MAQALAISSVRAMRRSLLLWYQKNKRDLPWRRTLRQRLFRASLLKKGRRLRLPLLDRYGALVGRATDMPRTVHGFSATRGLRSYYGNRVT